MMPIEFLFVTCCLEPTRREVLDLVVDNVKKQMPELLDKITVFDNASTQPGVQELLRSTFSNVRVADRNVGYWSAIDWWLTHLSSDPPQYTYIIESDMIHYSFDRIWLAAQFLKENPQIGSVRLHEYSIENQHLYNKDAPLPGSKKNIWQSHTNKVTQQPIVISDGKYDVHPANFLTQLPALNRYDTMLRVFAKLRELKQFSELDFQRFYHDEYPINSILDGGIFHCDPGCHGAKAVTSSWSSPQELAKMGYHGTRQGTIFDPSQYTVSVLG